MNKDNHLSGTENGKMARIMKFFFIVLTLDWILHLASMPFPSSMSAFWEDWAGLVSPTLLYISVKIADWDKK